MRAVAVVVLVDRVDAARVLARPVVDARRVVGHEVPAQRAVEVRRDVRVVAVDAGVHDADADAVAALLTRVGARRGRADELHVRLQPGERVAVDRRRVPPATAVRRAALALDVAPRGRGVVVRRAADGVAGGRGAVESALGVRLLGEGWIARSHGGDTDVLVLGDDRAAGVVDCLARGAQRRAVLIHDDVLGGAGSRGADQEKRAGESGGATEELLCALPTHVE